MRGVLPLAGALAVLSAAGGAQAQERLLGAALGFAGAQPKAAEPAAASGPAYLGLRGEPFVQGGLRGLRVTEVAPGSPAEAAGMQAGDVIYRLYERDRAPFHKEVVPRDQATLDRFLATQPPGRRLRIEGRREPMRGLSKDVTLAQAPDGFAPGAPSQGAPSTADVEAARTAYLQMCGKGAEKLTAATCEGMRRDLEVAAAAQAAARREAEVMGVYRQLCAPGSAKLSKETCESMLAEAKRTLAAAPPAPAPAVVRKTAASGELKSAYDELCAPGARQVSEETCAALKADAAPRPRRK